MAIRKIIYYIVQRELKGTQGSSEEVELFLSSFVSHLSVAHKSVSLSFPGKGNLWPAKNRFAMKIKNEKKISDSEYLKIFSGVPSQLSLFFNVEHIFPYSQQKFLLLSVQKIG